MCERARRAPRRLPRDANALRFAAFGGHEPNRRRRLIGPLRSEKLSDRTDEPHVDGIAAMSRGPGETGAANLGAEVSFKVRMRIFFADFPLIPAAHWMVGSQARRRKRDERSNG